VVAYAVVDENTPETTMKPNRRTKSETDSVLAQKTNFDEQRADAEEEFAMLLR
jgi:hypothetical protein